ncbi:uncharacterized protein ACWYII_046148 isoform 1-T1 [Salvelinus alpinus]
MRNQFLLEESFYNLQRAVFVYNVLLRKKSQTDLDIAALKDLPSKTRHQVYSSPPPEPPAEVGSVEVIRMVGQSSLMIGWIGWMSWAAATEPLCMETGWICPVRFTSAFRPWAPTVSTLTRFMSSTGGNHAQFRTDHTPFIIDHTHDTTASAALCTDHASPDCRTPPTPRHSGSTQSIFSRTVQLKPFSPDSEAQTVNGRRGPAPVAFLEEVLVPDRHVSPEGTADRPL